MAYFDFVQRLSRLTLARAEAVNALFQQVSDSFSTLPAANLIKQNKVTWAENTGTANVLIVDLASPPEAYEPGFELRVRLLADNTGPVTVNVNNLGVRQVRNFFGGQLSYGDLQAGSTSVMIYDGTHFRLVSATPIPLTPEQIADAIGDVVVPIQSVNGKTGDVVLNSSDVGAVPTVRNVSTGEGLTGGGALSANRTLALTGQALALHQVNTNGLLARVGTNAVNARTITAGNGIAVTNGNGVSGNPTVALSSGALESLGKADSAVQPPSGSGIIAVGEDNAVVARAITAGDGIVVTNGNGVSGNPTVAADIATDANVHAGASDKLVSAQHVYSANAPVATSAGGTYTIDMTAGRVFQRIATGNTTLANPTEQVAGQSGLIYFIQDGSGGRTLSFASDWKLINGAPNIDTGANKVNVFSYYVRSSGNISLNYLGSE